MPVPQEVTTEVAPSILSIYSSAQDLSLEHSQPQANQLYINKENSAKENPRRQICDSVTCEGKTPLTRKESPFASLPSELTIPEEDSIYDRIHRHDRAWKTTRGEMSKISRPEPMIRSVTDTTRPPKLPQRTLTPKKNTKDTSASGGTLNTGTVPRRSSSSKAASGVIGKARDEYRKVSQSTTCVDNREILSGLGTMCVDMKTPPNSPSVANIDSQC